MVADAIPEEVRQFVLQHIDSVAQMEALLLLRMDRQQEWSALQVAERLYISAHEAGMILAQLAARGFAAASLDAQEQSYRYEVMIAETDAVITRVTDYYARCLVPMTHLIHSKSKHRVQAFADAFCIRKKP